MFQGAIREGLDSLCLTEHFNTIGFDELYRHIQINYKQEGDLFLYRGLKIFPGMEVDVCEGMHILVLGPMSAILELNRRLEPNKVKGRFIPFNELCQLAKAKGCYIGAAHPYRKGSEINQIDEALLNNFDFLDMNGKDVAYEGEKAVEKVINLGKRLKIPVVAGSDTHQPNQYACVYNILNCEVLTFNELFSLLRDEKYERCVAHDVFHRVERAGDLKKKMKALHEEGLDYVDYLGSCLA